MKQMEKVYDAALRWQ